MYLENLTKTLEKMNKIKKENNFSKSSLTDLNNLPTFNGVSELRFKDNLFYMLNIGCLLYTSPSQRD